MRDTFQKKYRFRIVVPVFAAFNIYSSVADKTTALGPVCIAGIVNRMEEWDVEVIDENNLRRHGPRGAAGGADHELLQLLRPADIVGLYGGLTSTIPRLYEIARFYKDKGITTIAGGQHFVEENIEEALNSGIDYLVIGEGEETIEELLPALQNKTDLNRVRGIAYKKEGKVVCTEKRQPLTEFSKFPLPDFSLVRYAKIDIYPVERIRGCGMNCEFCTVKGKPRPADSERLLRQIDFHVMTQNAKHFFIVDDLFGQQREETIRFCRMSARYQKSIGKKLDFNAQIRLDKAKDPELLLAMRQAGINMVAIGFESPIQEELDVMHKNIKTQEMISLTRVFHEFGFMVHGMFIFGYPRQEEAGFTMGVEERIRQFRHFVRRARIDTLQVLLPVPLPGTELRRRLQQENRIYPKEDVGWQYYDGNFPLFEPDAPMTAEDMLYATKKIMGKFYQFRYMFVVGLNIFSFPALIFFLHNIRLGWKTWYRQWHNTLMRFAGWFVVRGWTKEFKNSSFLENLRNAQNRVRNHNGPK